MALTRRWLPLMAALVGCASPVDRPPEGDPLAHARAVTDVSNRYAQIPLHCYVDTSGGLSNPCWGCHTAGRDQVPISDLHLQASWDFPAPARENPWRGALVDRSQATGGMDDAEILAWVRQDNYTALREALARVIDYPGFRPDLDLSAGFDEQGFARDGSGWRAVRYTPFPGEGWPTTGALGDVYIRLPGLYRKDRSGALSPEIYAQNLTLLEEALGPGEGAPSPTYVGLASGIPVTRGSFPQGTELLHTLRYLDPDAPGGMSRRLKELRYARKVEAPDVATLLAAEREEQEEKDKGRPPRWRGSAESGLQNRRGWVYQGFIEDPQGRLRLQTLEEHLFCMGCHSGIGATVDGAFSLPRKLPGAQGWRPQDLRGQTDRPLLGTSTGEARLWITRAGSAHPMREGAPPDAPPGADLYQLLMPSPTQALALDKAWRALVRSGAYTTTRWAFPTPPRHVLPRAPDPTTTGLAERGAIFSDATRGLEPPPGR